MEVYTVKLWGGMALFSIVGAVGSYFGHASPYFLPELLFYILLLAHTFLSISLFARIETRSPDQYLIDALLVVSYLGLALSLGSPLAFFYCTLALFIFAPIKYAVLLGKNSHSRLLRRKILVDLSGTVLAAATLGIALLGGPMIAAWTLLIFFALASVRYLYTHPLYRL